MSKIDSEVLYLILTKVAGGASFFNYDPECLLPGQLKGTITHRQLGDVYERITGNRMSARTNWNLPLAQLNALLANCGLPALTPLLINSASANAEKAPTPSNELKKVLSTPWPPFIGLKALYRRGKPT